MNNSILAKRHTSKSQYWIRPGAFGSRAIFGVLADENSNTLWACSNDLSAVGVLVAGSQRLEVWITDSLLQAPAGAAAG
jgi:hypothetical protein